MKRSQWLVLGTLGVSSVAWAQASKPEPLQQIAQSVGVISGVWFMLMSYLLLAAWVSFLSALFPEWVKLKAQTVQTKSVRAFLFGLIVVLLLGVVGAILGGVAKHFPPAGVLVVLLFLALLILYALGWVPVTWVIGQRVASIAGCERQDLTVALLGALVLHLLVFLPVVGWAVVLYWAIVAVGVLALRP
ncbi:MAG: hypothetical protein C4295_10270 [Candidatus Fervidibacterota bacterium]